MNRFPPLLSLSRHLGRIFSTATFHHPVWVIFLLSLPSFSAMLRPGIYTMHDFHAFRLFEFDKCIQVGAFPCRWAADASWGYGQPVFNFYGQLSYWIGELWHVLGFSIIDSLKLVFILSLFLSAVAVFYLVRRIFGKNAAAVSALFYLYAPYRAVDVWVRGALPEAFSFVLFPLIFTSLYHAVSRRRTKHYILLSLLLSFLVINHNLSALLFAPAVLLWWLFLGITAGNLSSIKWLIPVVAAALGLSAFYLLPVLVESRFINLSDLVAAYYQYAHHFVSLRQLFLSTFWGYGGSIWGPNDTMSFSLGLTHWLTVLAGILLTVVLAVQKKLFSPRILYFAFFLFFAAVSIFLTHGKSEPVWKLIPALSYLQFPWRFLGLAAFFLSLCAGFIVTLHPGSHVNRLLTTTLLAAVILGQAAFFRPDIWRQIGDEEQFSGALWTEQIASSLSDYWPLSASSLPRSPAPLTGIFQSGEGSIITRTSTATVRSFEIEVSRGPAVVSFPITYFPGWVRTDSNSPIVLGRPLGEITSLFSTGVHTPVFEFTNTPARTWGNLISAVSLAGLLFTYIRQKPT